MDCIIAVNDIMIADIANIEFEYFTVATGAESHPTGVSRVDITTRQMFNIKQQASASTKLTGKL